MGFSVLSGARRLVARGPLPVEEVWRRYTEPRWWPRWAPHLREVDYGHAVVTPGTTGRVRGVGGLAAVFRIEAVDETTRTWSWSVRSGPLRLSFEHGVDAGAAPSGHTTAWLVVRGPWPVILAYAPLARYALGRLVASR